MKIHWEVWAPVEIHQDWHFLELWQNLYPPPSSNKHQSCCDQWKYSLLSGWPMSGPVSDHCTLPCTIQYSTVQYSTALYNTVQHCTIQYVDISSFINFAQMSVHVASECSLILARLVTVTAFVGDTLKVGLNVKAKCVSLRAWCCLSTKLTAPHFTHPLRHGLNSWLDILQIFDRYFLIAVDFRNMFWIINLTFKWFLFDNILTLRTGFRVGVWCIIFMRWK